MSEKLSLDKSQKRELKSIVYNILQDLWKSSCHVASMVIENDRQYEGVKRCLNLLIFDHFNHIVKNVHNIEKENNIYELSDLVLRNIVGEILTVFESIIVNKDQYKSLKDTTSKIVWMHKEPIDNKLKMLFDIVSGIQSDM